MGHLAQSNPIIKTDLRIKQKWIFNRKAHQLHPVSSLCPALSTRSCTFPSLPLGKGWRTSADTPSGISLYPARTHFEEKNKKQKTKPAGFGIFFFFFFAFKPNTLIFAFQAEGRLQPFFPALLLREWGTNPDASSWVRKGTELPQEVRSVPAALSRFLPPSRRPCCTGGNAPDFSAYPPPLLWGWRPKPASVFVLQTCKTHCT